MILLTPGPVTVKKKILEATSKPVVFHRTLHFEKLFRKCTYKARKVFGANKEYSVFVLTGSGTAAIEAAVGTLFAEKDKIFVVSNGDFGERLAKIALTYKKHIIHYKLRWAEPIVISVVEEIIKREKPTALALVALETSTGMVNPVHEVGKLCDKYKIKFLVDAVSAIGGEEIDTKKDNIDICITVPNKGLEGLPGLSLICVKEGVLFNESKLKTINKGYYLNLLRYNEFAKRNQTPTTPAVTLFNALNVTLDTFLKEGLEKRVERYRKLTGMVRLESKKLGWKELISDEKYKANAISSFCLPGEIDILKLNKFLMRHDVVVWGYVNNKHLNDKSILQISVMGNINRNDIRKTFRVIRNFVNKNKRKR